MKPRQFLLSSNSGFTLLELLVASLLSMLMVGMTVGLTFSSRELFFYDQSRVELQQNLRSAVDLVGIDIRESGERFNATFPAILITNGAGTDADELTLRRNLVDEVLIVCWDITTGTSTAELRLTKAGSTVATCTYGAQAANINAWETYRTANDGTVKIYIFDQTTKQGEWLDYQSVSDTGTENRLSIASHTFTNSYTGGTTSIYVMEERTYRLEGSLLQLIENNDAENPLNVAFGITAFQLLGNFQDGAVMTTIDETADWTTLASLEVALTGEIEVVGKSGSLTGNTITRSVTSRFFPRNILSN